MIFIMIIDLSGVQFGLKSYALFQNWTSAQREIDLKSQVRSQTKIARHEVQLPLYYIYSGIDQIQDLVSSNILLMQYWHQQQQRLHDWAPIYVYQVHVFQNIPEAYNTTILVEVHQIRDQKACSRKFHGMTVESSCMHLSMTRHSRKF